MLKAAPLHLDTKTAAVLALALAAIAFFVNHSVRGPMIQGDEGSYLANAAALAGFPNDLGGSRHAGYSLLLVPAFILGNTPDAVWLWVKLINALLYGWTVFLLWRVSYLLNSEADAKTRFVAVGLVSIYPMWVVMAGYAFAQIAFVPFFLLTLNLFIKAVNGGVFYSIWLGILSGFLYWIHPTGMVSIIALGISSLYVAWVRARFGWFTALISSMVVMIVAYHYGLVPWLHSRMTISGFPPQLHYPGVGRVIEPLLSLDGIKDVLARTGGHNFYLSIGSSGLIWVGLNAFTSTLFGIQQTGESGEFTVRRAMAVFLVLSLVGTIALSVLMFSAAARGAQRLDHWLYGRYVEGVIAPILLAGALRSSFRKGLWAIPAAVLGCILLATKFDTYTGTEPYNISAFWQYFFLREQGLWMWLASGCVLVGLGAGLPRRFGILAILTIFVFSSYCQIHWHKKNANNAAQRWAAATAVRERFPRGTCVAFDHAGIKIQNRTVFWLDFGFQLFDYQLKRMNVKRWLEECDGPMFSFSRDLHARGLDVYPWKLSPHGGPVLWMKGPLPENDLYPINVVELSGALALVLGPGWHDLERTHVWSSSKALLRLPVPTRCRSNGCRVRLTYSVYGASERRPVNIIFRGIDPNPTPSQVLTIQTPARQDVTLPLNPAASLYSLSIEVPDAISPKVLRGGEDDRVLGIALYSIDLIPRFMD